MHAAYIFCFKNQVLFQELVHDNVHLACPETWFSHVWTSVTVHVEKWLVTWPYPCRIDRMFTLQLFQTSMLGPGIV